jgi:hypothetical protein
MQAIEASVLNAMDSRTTQILAGWEHPVTTLSMDCSTQTASAPPEWSLAGDAEAGSGVKLLVLRPLFLPATCLPRTSMGAPHPVRCPIFCLA